MNGFAMKSSAPASIAFVFSGRLMLDVTHDHGQHARWPRRARRLPAHLVAVEPRHEDVEQDEVRLFADSTQLERLARRRVAVTTS